MFLVLAYELSHSRLVDGRQGQRDVLLDQYLDAAHRHVHRAAVI